MRGFQSQRRRHQVLAAVSIVAVSRSVSQKVPLCMAFSSSPSNKAATSSPGWQSNSPTRNAASSKMTFPVFPYEYWDKRHELLSSCSSSLGNVAYDHVKVLHVVRHAQGTHNVNKNYREEINLDARLTELGRRQCEQLAQKVSNLPVDLIVTSPMTRCVQTALYSFPHLVTTTTASSSSSTLESSSSSNIKSGIPFVAHEDIRETVNFKCDQRRTISEIASEFGDKVDFSVCEVDEDYIWNEYETRLGRDYDDHRESAELHVVAQRGRQFFQWLQGRPEQHVVLCTHSAFLRCLKSWGHPGGVPMQVPQRLIDQQPQAGEDWNKLHPPVLHYRRGDEEHDAFEEWMRSDYENAEMRSFVIGFQSSSNTVV